MNLLTGKQRNYLKGLVNKIRPIGQIGKSGVTPNFITQLEDALKARELVKITILENSFLSTKITASEVAKLTKSEFIQAIGNKFVLYKKSRENPKIELPR